MTNEVYSNKSYAQLCADLVAIGIRPGDTVVVHSSMRSMGYVEGGAPCVIAALLHAVGDEGTLLLPTFTYRTSYVDSYYSNKDTPSCVGLLSEVFRQMPGVVRTNHPTHSVALCGRLTEALIKDEALDDTPMGAHSPYRRLAAVGTKILMLGCPLAHNSYMHALEEEADAPYALRGHQTYTVVDEKGAKSERHIRRHNFNRSNGAILQRYERAIDVLLREEYQTATVHGANAVLFDSVSLKARVLQKMKEDPYYFIDDPNGFYK